MPKIESIIKSEIIRLARRQVKMAFMPLKRDVRQMRRKLSGLSKTVALLNQAAKQLRLEQAEPKLEATPEEVKASRITPERIAGLRRKLGVSQRELGILAGASLGAIQSWEKGKFRPKPDKKAALIALRKIGKRGVRKLLAEKAPVKEKPSKELAKPAGKVLSPKRRKPATRKPRRAR